MLLGVRCLWCFWKGCFGSSGLGCAGTVCSLCEVVVWVVLLVTGCGELFCEQVVVFFDRQYSSWVIRWQPLIVRRAED